MIDVERALLLNGFRSDEGCGFGVVERSVEVCILFQKMVLVVIEVRCNPNWN